MYMRVTSSLNIVIDLTIINCLYTKLWDAMAKTGRTGQSASEKHAKNSEGDFFIFFIFFNFLIFVNFNMITVHILWNCYEKIE